MPDVAWGQHALLYIVDMGAEERSNHMKPSPESAKGRIRGEDRPGASRTQPSAYFIYSPFSMSEQVFLHEHVSFCEICQRFIGGVEHPGSGFGDEW